MTNKQQFSGKTLDDAILEAAKFYSIDKAFVCYNLVSKSQGGFLAKIFSSKVQIEAWVETAKEDLEEAARKAVREALQPKIKPEPEPKPKIEHKIKGAEAKIRPESRSKSEPRVRQMPKPKAERAQAAASSGRQFIDYTNPEVKSLIAEYNQQFFSAFNVPSDNYSTEVSENQLLVHVQDEYLEGLLTKSDKLSLSYEHVFKRIAQKKIGDISGRAVLDAGSSDEKRQERLIGMAKSLAEKVKKTGRSVVLSSKSSQERRVIHLALDGYEGIGTRSVGVGDKRRLVIYSNDKSQSNDKRPKRNSSPKKKSQFVSQEKRDHE